jgi:hypothetical protein
MSIVICYRLSVVILMVMFRIAGQLLVILMQVCQGEPVESLQSHLILTMSHWSSGLPVCFPS